MSERHSSGGRSWWPFGIVIFFLVLAVFQAGVLYLGFAHRNTLIEDRPYERGLVYQQVIDAESRVKERGLNLKISADRARDDGMRSVLIKVTGPEPLPNFAERAVVQFKRPASGASDTAAMFSREGAAGHFSGSALLREGGLWLLELRLTAEGKDYLFRQEIFLP